MQTVTSAKTEESEVIRSVKLCVTMRKNLFDTIIVRTKGFWGLRLAFNVKTYV